MNTLQVGCCCCCCRICCRCYYSIASRVKHTCAHFNDNPNTTARKNARAHTHTRREPLKCITIKCMCVFVYMHTLHINVYLQFLFSCAHDTCFYKNVFKGVYYSNSCVPEQAYQVISGWSYCWRLHLIDSKEVLAFCKMCCCSECIPADDILMPNTGILYTVFGTLLFARESNIQCD